LRVIGFLGCHRIGGTLEGGCLVEHVPPHFRAPFHAGSLAELKGALAIDGGTAYGDGLGHCGI
jgi:hypothetical protein